MSDSKQILFIGATGYLGGTTLALLLDHPRVQSKEYRITALIRDAAKAKAFESDVLKTVVGSMTDHDLLLRLCRNSDIVFQCAHSDLLPETQVILAGMKQRFEATGVPPVLIHTSGAGILGKETLGIAPAGEDGVLSDMDSREINNLPEAQVHRLVDITIVSADINIVDDVNTVQGEVISVWGDIKKSSKPGYIKSYIVVPPTIWGISSTQWTTKGLQKPISQQVPAYIKLSLKRGKPMIIGEGLNVWSHVEVHDVAQFYYTLFDVIISDDKPEPPHGYHGFYFLENGEYAQMDIIKEIAKALFERGKVNSEEIVPLSEEELAKNPFYDVYLATNCRYKGVRSRSIGWQPTKTTADLIASMEADVELYLKLTSRGISFPNSL